MWGLDWLGIGWSCGLSLRIEVSQSAGLGSEVSEVLLQERAAA